MSLIKGKKLKIAFIGSGIMADAIISGLLTKDAFLPENIWAAGPRDERAKALSDKYGINGTTDSIKAISMSDIVVLSVKPQTLSKVLIEIKEAITNRHLVVSVVTGAKMSTIGALLNHNAIVRCMPNIACQIHYGTTIWTATKYVDNIQREIVKDILISVGHEIYVQDELDVDRSTAVTGTGPAIIAHFIKSLEDAANYIGMPRPLVRQSVLNTLIGTVEMIRSSDRHISDLIDGVTSPAGTTSRAMHVLNQGKISAIMTDAVDAAFNRSMTLGSILDDQLLSLEKEKKDF